MAFLRSLTGPQASLVKNISLLLCKKKEGLSSYTKDNVPLVIHHVGCFEFLAYKYGDFI